jgi:hypothetical protein
MYLTIQSKENLGIKYSYKNQYLTILALTRRF